MRRRRSSGDLDAALDDVLALARAMTYKNALAGLPPEERLAAALARAGAIAEEDVAINRAIGEHGIGLIAAALAARGGSGPAQILTHCNAGWLATVDWGTATAGIYMAHEAGIPLHVWVDETRPRNQGASLTAFELAGHGISHEVIVVEDGSPDHTGALLDEMAAHFNGLYFGILEFVFNRVFPRVFRGTHVRHPAVTTLRGASVTVAAPGAIAYAVGSTAQMGDLSDANPILVPEWGIVVTRKTDGQSATKRVDANAFVGVGKLDPTLFAQFLVRSNAT